MGKSKSDLFLRRIQVIKKDNGERRLRRKVRNRQDALILWEKMMRVSGTMEEKRATKEGRSVIIREPIGQGR